MSKKTSPLTFDSAPAPGVINFGVGQPSADLLPVDLIQAAMDKGLKTLRTDLVRGIEDAAIEAVKKFDFFQRAEIKNYAIDPNGSRHDMVIMIKRLHANWTDY